jgi:hypothetical protein
MFIQSIIMNIVYIVVVFSIVFLSYFHIINQYQTSEDSEIYEMDYKDNANLQETCNIKQPVIFQRNSTLEYPIYHIINKL